VSTAEVRLTTQTGPDRRPDATVGGGFRGHLNRLVQGLERGMRFFTESPPPEVDRTPREQVECFDLVTVSRFQGSTRRHRTPVLLVPALMIKPYLFDLRPGHSLAESLLERGFDVFVVDFGVPDEADAHLRISDYVFSFLPRALEAVTRASGQPAVTLLGYCTGGLFALLCAASRQSQVANLVLLACPMDYEKMGVISFITRRYQRQLHALLDRLGYVPGFVPSLAVDVADPLGGLTRYSDLFLSVWDHEYRKGRQALNHWLHDLVPGPRDAWKEFLDTFVVGNALVEGRVELAGRTLHLEEVRCPLLALAGKRDPIATEASTREIVDLVGSPDRTFQVVPGGHVGIVAGSSAPQTTWRLVEDWLEPRS